jgi:IclR family transcriptional regulator, acetate operon repressor
MSSQPTLQTVERALAFLEYVAAARDPQTVQQVAAALDLNITTCYHLMHTLIARGYIERNDDATLNLGTQVSVLFASYQQKFSIGQRLADVVNRLALQTYETAFLSILEDRKVVLKVLTEGSQALRVSGLYVGISGNEHRRASGRAILANLSEVERNAILENSLANLSVRERSATRKALKEELELTLKRGWSMDGEQSEHGISSIGAAVFDARGKVYGAIGVVTPTFRMDRSKAAFVEAVMEASHKATKLVQSNSTTVSQPRQK